MHLSDPDFLIILHAPSSESSTGGGLVGVTLAGATQAQSAKELAQAAREQAQAARDQAQGARDQAQQLREQVRDQVRASLQGAQDAVNQSDRAGSENVQIQTGPNGVRIIRTGVPPVPGIPGTVTTFEPRIPPEVKDISIAFFICMAFMVVGWPIARALGRRIERRSDQPAIAPGMADQLQRIEQAVDAMSIEIERISESQRFMAKLQNANAERGALPAERA